MNYVIDPFATPALVVLISDDLVRVELVAQTYANQVGHGILIADGPDPADAQFQPVVPALVIPGITLPIIEGSVPALPAAESEG